MTSPEEDIDSRIDVWNSMQMIWMDVETNDEINSIALRCSESKYTLNELKEIYWNEVYPAVNPNINQVIPEWTGFNREYLIEIILKHNTFGKPVPSLRFNPFYSARWWRRLEKVIIKNRDANS